MTLLLVLALLSQEKPRPLVLKGGQVVTLATGEIPGGTVVLEGGKIRRVGSDAEVTPGEVPAGALVIDLPKGSQVLPGFIDLHSQLGSACGPGRASTSRRSPAATPT